MTRQIKNDVFVISETRFLFKTWTSFLTRAIEVVGRNPILNLAFLKNVKKKWSKMANSTHFHAFGVAFKMAILAKTAKTVKNGQSGKNRSKTGSTIVGIHGNFKTLQTVLKRFGKNHQKSPKFTKWKKTEHYHLHYGGFTRFDPFWPKLIRSDQVLSILSFLENSIFSIFPIFFNFLKFWKKSIFSKNWWK